MMDTFLHGLAAAVPVSIVSALLVYLCGGHIATTLHSDPVFSDLSARYLRWFWTSFFALFPFGLGIIASYVYAGLFAPWDQSAWYYLLIALDLALALSMIALTSHTAMAIEKVLLNFVSAIGFGVLIPWLAH
jgi:hypothetical protein